MSEIRNAIKIVLESKDHRKMFYCLTIFVFGLFVLIPVFSIPGNDLRFYLTILRPRDYIAYIILAPIIATIITMQVTLFKQSLKKRHRLTSVAQGGVGAYSAIVGGLLATAACSSCIAGLLGFLGAGAVFYIAQNYLVFAGLGILISLFSLYMSAQKVNGHCTSCNTVCK